MRERGSTGEERRKEEESRREEEKTEEKMDERMKEEWREAGRLGKARLITVRKWEWGGGLIVT